MTSKLLSIFISSLILFQSFNIHIKDIACLNDLLVHAQFHKEKYGDNIFVFFSKHYGELKENHNKKHQEEDHSRLPFNDNLSFGLLTAFVLNDNKYSIEHKDQFFYQNSNFFYIENYTSLDEFDIFQPPKIA